MGGFVARRGRKKGIMTVITRRTLTLAGVSWGGGWGKEGQTTAAKLVTVRFRTKNPFTIGKLSDLETDAEAGGGKEIVHGERTAMIDLVTGEFRFFGGSRKKITPRRFSVPASPAHLLNIVNHLERGASVNDE